MDNVMKLSDKAIATISMCLLKCLAEEVDIRELLSNLDLVVGDTGELFVTNPPVMEIPNENLDA